MEEKIYDKINKIEKTNNGDRKQEEIMNKINNYKILNNNKNNNEEQNIKEYPNNNIINKENHNVLIKENYDVTNKNGDITNINDDNINVKINCENNNEKREVSFLNGYSDNNINIDKNINKSSNHIEKDNPPNDKHNNNNINNNLSYGDNKQNNILDDTDISIYNNLNDTSNENIMQNNNSKTSGNLKNYYKDLPTVIIVIGMAGSGKTTYVGSLYNYLKVEQKKKVYTMNLDPAVKFVQYPLNIDIRDSIKYHEIMKEYKLGPNGAIMTCLNLFATRFDKVIEILEKRKSKLHYIIVDTPGQIEVFNWSASGNIILETLSVSFPVVINYIIDTVRCERPITFMSNMLYACSVLYKSRLPFLACFNKTDIIKHDKCIEWMTNYDTFNDDVLNDESYMASFSRSCALMINEFYEGIKTVGVSSKTNEGFNNILKNLQILKEEYLNEYVSSIEKQMKKIKQRKEKDVKIKMEALLMEKQKEISSSKINT
ncbi:XPA binding protein 1, putative [Plasmodium sp. DRC-Itaito]|nr:XPA binding protein 1, putative [Plasmodium sp. DRC-Itaito]